MDISPPSKQDLIEAASRNFLSLTDEELDGFHSLIRPIFGHLELLDSLPGAAPPRSVVNRDPGERPSPEEDPYNAILRRCLIEGSASEGSPGLGLD